MKEDILEQLVDDYLQIEGFFTRHNIKYRPRPDHPQCKPKEDSNHSDIDVLGIHPRKKGADKVRVVSCKSWQGGFRVATKLSELTKNKIVSGREAWRGFRELMIPKWSEAFIDAIRDATGSRQFTYVLAVTAVVGDRKQQENHAPFISALRGNPVRIIDLTEMLNFIKKTNTKNTVASFQIGRILQLMRAAEKGTKELLESMDSIEDI